MTKAEGGRAGPWADVVRHRDSIVDQALDDLGQVLQGEYNPSAPPGMSRVQSVIKHL